MNATTRLTFQITIDVDHREDMPYDDVLKLADQVRFSTSEVSGCGPFGCYKAKQTTKKTKETK
jgi:hypothetical protein